MNRPNILFVIWDACRLEAARQYAPNLASLAEENFWFENAIAPAGYSLPSHASIYTGKYLHEHETFSRSHEFESLPLLDILDEQGYTRYGVSANGFASPRYGFDEPFDVFHNTTGQMVYPEGLDVHRYVAERESNSEDFSPDDLSYSDLLRATFNHPHPFKSLANVSSAGLSELVSTYPLLQKVPHPRFSKYHEFSYSPSKNTDVITSVLQQEADSEGPFFLFTNYMDSHHPYAPPERLQREYCDRTFSYYELAELAHLSHPWNYLQRVESGDVPPTETIESIRGLYAGEVRRADAHLGELLESLEQNGLYEETLVVITADHGENLGETDRMGENRMGHECSASDQLLRVPLVVAHPDLNPKKVEEYVSIKNLFRLFTEELDEITGSDEQILNPLVPSNGVAASQVPPPANPTLTDRYPELSEILNRSISVTYADGWKVVVTSQGEEHCWHDGKQRTLKQAPEQVVEQARSHLSDLLDISDRNRELSDTQISQLESLGYL